MDKQKDKGLELEESATKQSKKPKHSGDKQKRTVSSKEKIIPNNTSAAAPKTKTDKTKPAAKPKVKPKKIKVLFVCTGNTCRSPMAEQLFKSFLKKCKKLSGYEVSSAGLYAEPDSRINPFALAALTSLGLKADAQKSRQLTEVMAAGADLIVCMTAGHKAAIDGHAYIFSVGELTGGGDVPDPYGMDIERYTAVARYLEYACGDIFAAAEKLRN